MMRSALATIALAACHAAPPATTPATTATTATPTTAGAPCFADRAALDGAAVFKQFEQYGAMFQGDDPAAAPRTTFGTCTVAEGKIKDAAGTTVAEINCGLDILLPGIHDDLGLALGAHGQDVLARLPAGHGQLVCRSNGPGQVRCNPERREEDDTDASWYVVAGDLPAGTDVLTGAAAEAFFAPLTVVEIEMSVWCH
ncbi:MAG: hypothetical protein K8W52_07015 [Deltaproteobacteria bacterium]|nr:hypothetical protein [Deltaproteobacteria bacterium]